MLGTDGERDRESGKSMLTAQLDNDDDDDDDDGKDQLLLCG